jgi:hypothetical protein
MTLLPLISAAGIGCFAPNDRSASTIRGHLAAIHDPNVANG